MVMVAHRTHGTDLHIVCSWLDTVRLWQPPDTPDYREHNSDCCPADDMLYFYNDIISYLVFLTVSWTLASLGRLNTLVRT